MKIAHSKRGRRLVRVSALMAGLVAIAVLFALASLPPFYVYANREIDLGKVRQGEIIKYEIRLRNISLRTEILEDISASCACTTAKAESYIIRPMRSLVIPIEIDTGPKVGRSTTTVQIKLKGRNHFHVRLAHTSVQEWPRELVFGTLKRGEVAERSFVIRSVKGLQLSVNRLEFDDRYFTAAAAAGSGNSDGPSVSVRINPEISYGSFRTVLRVHTNDPDIPIKKVAVHGRILGLVEPARTTLALGMLTPGETHVETLELSSPYQRPFSVVEVRAADGKKPLQDIFWSVGRSENPDLVQLELAITVPEHQTNVYSQRLVLIFDCGGTSYEKRINLIGYIRSDYKS